MKTDYLQGEKFALLQNQRGVTCVSIIAPTHKLSPDRRSDALQIEKAVQRAKEYIQDHYAESESEFLTKSIDNLYAQIDFMHNSEGLGLFVSKDVQQIVPFHFPVKEKIVIGNSFELRDLLYDMYYQKKYLLLSLAEKGAKLYEGSLNFLQEVRDIYFPAKYIDQYEYNTPSRGSSYTGHAFTKQFERDKSQMEELRYKKSLEKLYRHLKNYLFNQTPLILAGTAEAIASFKKVSGPKISIGEIHGNQFHRSLLDLAIDAYEIMKSFLDYDKENQVKELFEQIAEGKGKTGLASIWQATQEGRAYKLIVEKDYAQPGFILANNPYQLHLQPPKEQHEILPDAVNTLMQIVLEKKGEVIIVENERIENYGRIGLVTRY